MKIGDKIRFIHSKGQGIVKRVIDDKTIEVEIEDGFRIPVLRNEVVVIAVEEAKRFNAGYVSEKEQKSTGAGNNNGIWMAFVPFNDKIYSLYLVNDSEKTILFTMGENALAGYEGIASGVLVKNSSEKIKEYKIADFENWPEFHAQVLYFKQGKTTFQGPLEKKIKFKASSFYKSKKYNGVLDKEAFLYSLDSNGKIISQDEVGQLFNPDPISVPTPSLKSPSFEIDLHIEKIHPDYKMLPGNEILKYQINYFEKTLENAIATGMKEIIFIHGSGNGVLKNSLHKKLSENIFIKYFEDARKEKFGYGATLVKIK